MGGASAYLWLYFVCGFFLLCLVVLAFVLARLGRGSERAGAATRVGQGPEASAPPRDEASERSEPGGD